MLELSQDFVTSQAEAVLAVDGDDRLRLLQEIRALAEREDAPALPIMVGHVFLYRRLYELAEAAFQLATTLPGARRQALFELGVTAAARHALDEAADWLFCLEAEAPLDGHQLRVLAQVLGRKGDLDGAVDRLEASYRQEPEQLEECMAIRQFCEYVVRFPMDEALRRCEALTAFYPFKTAAEIAEDVMEASAKGRPYSLVRLNDGEGSVVSLSLEDEVRHQALYRRNRRDFHVGFWFGDTQTMADPAFLRAMHDFNTRLGSADVIGAHHPHSLAAEYAWGGVRNIPSIFNLVRKLEQLQTTVEPGRIGLCSPQINQQLLFQGHLDRILSSQERLGLVTPHVALPDALKQRFGLRDVRLHKTPGEALLKAGGQREPFGVWHGRLCAELREAEPGLLYLVGAGVQSKIYCDLIKRAGGLALDIGAVPDIWLSAPTRAYEVDVTSYALATP